MQRKESKYNTSEILLICFIIISNLIHLDNFTIIKNSTNKSIMLEHSKKQQENSKNYSIILYNDVFLDSTRYGLKIGKFKKNLFIFQKQFFYGIKIKVANKL